MDEAGRQGGEGLRQPVRHRAGVQDLVVRGLPGQVEREGQLVGGEDAERRALRAARLLAPVPGGGPAGGEL